MDNDLDTPTPDGRTEGGAPRGIHRARIGFHVVMQIVLAAVILVAVNFLAFRHYKRWDFSMDARFTLAEQTKRVIEDIRGEVDLILFFSAASPVYDNLLELLKEYQYRGRGKVSLELVDPYRNLTRARELQARYKFGATENVLIVDYNGRSRFLTESDLAEYDEADILSGEPPVLRAFKGEEALTGALIGVSREERDKVYFADGLGGSLPGEDSPISLWQQYIERQFMSAERLDLGSVDEVPGDADALVLAGPRYDLSEREIEVVRKYWANAGRLIVLLDPDAVTTRLRHFLASLGVTPRDDRILRTVDMQTVVGILRDVTGRFVPGSPTTVGLHGVDSVFVGGTKSLETRKPLDGENIEITTVVESADGFWGETSYAFSQGEPILFEPNEDTPGPLTIAATVEQGGIDDARVRVNSARLLVVGNAAFATDDALTQQNLDFLLNAVNWMVDREELIGIAPKSVTSFQLSLSDDQLSQISLLTMGAIPGLVAVAGVLVWLRRRA